MLDREALDHILTVGGKPLLAQLVELFHGSVPPRLAAIAEAVTAGRAETILQQSHALRSGASNLGATALTAVAAVMEMRARAGELEGLDQLVAALWQRYADVQRELAQVLQELDAAPATRPAAAAATATATAGRRVLALIEDNPDNQLLTRAMLQETYDIVAFRDGPTALQAIHGRPPDLVLLDISLPGMDGEEVLRQLRAHPQTRGLRVLALTAHAMKGDRERFLAAGFDGYLAKPVDEAALRETVARLLPPAR